MKSVGVAIITHTAEALLPNCLKPLLQVPDLKILVVNSSSPDRTVEVAKELGADTLVVPRSTFNHGETRDLARKKLGTEIVVMMTPDAILEGPDALKALVAPLQEEKASISYLRQVPHKDADFFESFPRVFNYPKESHLRSMKDLEKWGSYLSFCSNSCAGYLNAALDEVEGFQHVLIGEDTLVAAKLLEKGHTLAYVADKHVFHSHRYTLLQEFKRSFDTGLARRGSLQRTFGKDEKRGLEYIRALLITLKKESPQLLPYALLQVLVKYVGYSFGKLGPLFPKKINALFSSQDFYWKS